MNILYLRDGKRSGGGGVNILQFCILKSIYMD